MSEGIIFIDREGKIQLYNQKSKEIFGIIYNEGRGHKRGRIEDGDIVIIANNNLGKDDGKLTTDDLKIIGIDNEDIDIGDAVIGIGVYGSGHVDSMVKYMKGQKKGNNMYLNYRISDKNIEVVIDFRNKIIDIILNGEHFLMEYINAIGHMLLLDSKCDKVKFYQAKGYTIRKESIKDILTGKEYMAKGKNSDILDVIGNDIFEVHGYIEAMREFYEVARGKELSYKDKFIEINGRPTLCSLVPIDRDNIRIGALLKVKDISELKRITKERDEALIKLQNIEKRLEENDYSMFFPNVIGDSIIMQRLKELAYRASKTNSTLLILGESGTGKSLLAKEIHDASYNKDMPFIHVNCGSIPENLIESELFGYEGGAFTGAKSTGKIGFFEMAQGGTIFLDEVGELSLAMQVKLLQFLQDKSFYRVGGNKKVNVDVRIMAATNKNLENEVIEGKFREDLFYRVNVFPIYIAPLREHKQDIYQLVCHLLPKICIKIGCEEKRISSEAINKLVEYDWPGNIRELENVLERSVNFSESNIILSDHIKILNKRYNKNIEKHISTMKDVVMDAEKNALINALNATNGNKKKAMRMLGMGKTSFYDKLKKYKI